MMRIPRHLPALALCLVAAAGFSAPSASAQVLIREVISREVAIHVGGVQTPEIKEIVSREVSLNVENGPAEPYPQVISREISLAVGTAEAPPAITGLAVSLSPTGDSATLDWSSYNQWAVSDIVHFAVYLSDDGPFSDVSGLTPFRIIAGESTSVTLTGLTPWADHFFAVVAVDVLGNFLPAVSYSAGYVLQPQVISREVSLFVGAEPVPPYREALSREMTIAVTTSQSPPAVTDLAVSLSATGDAATLTWSGYNQWAVGDIARFDIYLSDDGPIGDVSALTPFASVGAEQNSAALGGLAPWRDHYFAVVPVDALGNFLPAVTYSAGYVLMPQAISREWSLFVGAEPEPPYREVVSRELSIVVPDAAVPAPVTGTESGFAVFTSTTDFGSVVLDWSSYIEVAQRDIVRYRVYVSDQFFEHVGGMAPFAYLPAGSSVQTLGGLTGMSISHFAVVAEDALGGFDPVVRSYSAQASVSGVGEVRNLASSGGPDSITFTWESPQSTDNFLTGYLVYFGGATVPVELPANVTSWTAPGLERSRAYPFRITTRNVFGTESGGSSTTGVTWLDNPADVALTTLDDQILITWAPSQPSSLVRYYAIYRSDAPISSVAGLSPAFVRTGASVLLGGFADVSGKHFAVAAANLTEDRDPSVASVHASKQTQTIGFPTLATGPVTIPLVATASSGLPVTFSSSANGVASVNGSVLTVIQGGPVTVTASQPGDASFWPATVSQSLRLPPVITSFTVNGTELQDGALLRQPSAELRVTGRDVDGIAGATFQVRPADGAWQVLGTDQIPGNGLTAPLSLATLANGPHELGVEIRSTSEHTTSRTHPVHLDLQPVLALTASGEVMEGQSLGATVTLDRARSTDLVVTLASSHSSQLDSGPPVTIPAGQTSAIFTLLARPDEVVEAPLNVRLTATAPGAAPVEWIVQVIDDDWPTLQFTVDRAFVSERDGPNALTGTLRRTPVSSLPMTVWLATSNVTDVVLPDKIIIPGGAATVDFPIGVIDNDLVDGPRSADLSGEVRVSGIGPIAETPALTIEIGDDEGPSLELAFDGPFITEGESATLRLRRVRGSTAKALSVRFAVFPAARIQLPATVTLPAGLEEITVDATVPDDGTETGNSSVRITATASGHNPGQLQLLVTDHIRPDLVPVDLGISATEVETERTFTVTYGIRNQGNAAADAPFLQRVFLSADRVPGNDILLAQHSFSGGLAEDSGFERSVQVTAPREAGTWWVIVTTDAGSAIDEVLETNNSLVSSVPLRVLPAYGATVSTEVSQVPANTPIPFTGSAVREDGSKVPHVLVHIHLLVSGTERIIAALTDAQGDFATTWRPLPGEGGDYEVGATHPGIRSAAEVQGSFSILTLRTEFPRDSVVLEEAGLATFTATLSNPTAHGLTGLTLVALDLPTGLTIGTPLPATSLAGGESIQAGITVTAANGYSGNRTITLRLTSDEGLSLDVEIPIEVRPLLPRLVIHPVPLECSVLRGEQKVANLTIENQGGAHTGPIDVLLPEVPWMELASATPLLGLAPGETANVSLLLKPAATDPLTVHTGSLVVAPTLGSARYAPFAIRVVSDQIGDLEIEVVDEAFYFAQGSPKLEGATVTLRDAVSGQAIETRQSPPDGTVRFEGLSEGWYAVEVASPDHTAWKGNVQVNAGEDNARQVFVTRETVKYSWTVEEIELEDRYRITVESTFETNVPAPVVTVTPSVLDVEDLTVLGQTKVINFVIENHGWIAADHGQFTFDSHPFYEAIPLIENIGLIPAKSALVIPVTVRRTGEFAEDGSVRLLSDPPPPATPTGAGPVPVSAKKMSAPQRADVPCEMMGRIRWDFLCGIIPIPKSVSIPASGVSGHCENPPRERNPITDTSDPPHRSTSVATSYVGGSASCLELCLAKTALDCALGYIPVVGCIWGAANCLLVSVQGDVKQWIYVCGTLPLCVDPTGIANTFLCAAGSLKCYRDFAGSDPVGAFPEITAALASASAFSEPGLGDPWLDMMDQSTRDFDPAVAAAFARIEQHLDFGAVMLGNRQRVLRQADADVREWYDAFNHAHAADSEDGVRITSAERVVLADLAASLSLDIAEFDPVIDRWNRTIDYADRAITEVADVPGGESLDFIPWSEILAAAQAVAAAHVESQALGFADPGAELVARFTESRERLQGRQGGVCARVKIRIDQEAVMTRSAFRANLELSNAQADDALSNVGFDLRIADAAGQDATDRFNIQVSALSGLESIDGSGTILPQSAGSVQWTLIPRDSAAPLEDTVYSIGGTITYTQGGTPFNIPVTPVDITVRPDASLHLKYFHQRDVFSDDPHTDIIEPRVPFQLAVMVENRGAGAARNLSITSAQPEIVENDKGLLIDFTIIGTQVGGQPRSPSLKADFGTLEPGTSSIATWDIVASLQGLFIDYQATFQHLDGFGDERISLIKEVGIHEMIHRIEALGDLSDGLPDFLVNDVPDIHHRPDTVHLSDGSTAPVVVVEEGTLSGAVSPSNLTVTLTTSQGSGWSYLRIPDPAAGAYQLAQVIRSDGLVIPVGTNVWITDRTFIGLGRRPVPENILHLADRDSTGSYTLTYEEIAPDTQPPVSSVLALPSSSPAFIPVRWNGDDDRGLASFDIHVSEDGGPFTPWLTGTTKLSYLFPGEVGRTYAFYSRATDTSGNTEPVPASPQATTTVAAGNLPPVLGPIDDIHLAEGTILDFQVDASDPDGLPEALRFSIQSEAPGLVIDPATGRITWITRETDGGRSVPATVTVTDAGLPLGTASATFTITVEDVNEAPTLRPFAAASASPGGSFVATATASDPDFPVQSLTFGLGSGAPAGMTIDPATGRIEWTVPEEAAPEVLPIEVSVTDSGTPSASDRTFLALSVRENGDGDEETEIPTVQTLVPSEIASSSARSGGVVTDDGGAPVTSQGVVFATSPAPRIGTSEVLPAPSSTSVFSSWLVGLEAGTQYYLRAYAVNAAGTAYGEEVSFVTAAEQPGTRRLLYLKPGDPTVWSPPGLPGSQSVEIGRWAAEGFEVALGDSSAVRLTPSVLSKYRIMRLFPGLDRPGGYPDAAGAVLHRWVAGGGVAIVEAGRSSGINAFKRFGVARIDGRNGGISGSEWLYRGAPLGTGRVSGLLGPVPSLAGSTMDRPIYARGSRLRTAAQVGKVPAIAYGHIGLGKVVLHFLNGWSQDADFPDAAFHASIQDGANLVYLTNLMRFAGLPTRWDEELPVTAMVSQPVAIPLTGEDWTLVSVRGLPPGLRYDAATGSIVGSARRTGAFEVQVTVRESDGSLALVRFALRLVPLPDWSVGKFAGTVDRDALLNEALGGWLAFSSSPSGICSGRLTLGNRSYPFRDALESDGNGSVILPVEIARKGQSSLPLTLTLREDLSFDGAVHDGLDPVPLSGWRNRWNPRQPASAFQGRHSFGLELPESLHDDALIPQGTGFGSLVVTGRTGSGRLAGRLSDGTAFTAGGFLGPEGQFPVFRPLYPATARGSLLGVLGLTLSGTPENDLVDGDLTWFKPPSVSTRDRIYRDGFAPIDLRAQGGRYLAPVAPSLVIGLDATRSGNARLLFSAPDGDVVLPLPSPDLQLTVGPRNRVILPPKGSNPRGTTLSLAPATGSFRGGFSMVDPHPDGLGTPVTRKGTFHGQMFRDGNGQRRGYGYFLLPDFPDESAVSTAPTPIRSGQVILEPTAP